LGAVAGSCAMGTFSELYRIALSPFQPHNRGILSVVGDLARHGFLAHQRCLVGTPAVITPLATSLGSGGAVYPEFRQLFENLEPLQAPHAHVPVVASAGPITDVLLKHKSWLSSPAAAPLNRYLQSGGVVLAINGLDHQQFVTAARLLLRHGNGKVLTEIFNWPTRSLG
jgi:hypothetical protein